MSHANLVADELHKVGFRTRVIVSNAVEVSLNRQVSTLEVQLATDKLFDEVQFNFTPVNDKVIISW